MYCVMLDLFTEWRGEEGFQYAPGEWDGSGD